MKSRAIVFLSTALALSLALSLYLLFARDQGARPDKRQESSPTLDAKQLHQSIGALRRDVGVLRNTMMGGRIGETGAAGNASNEDGNSRSTGLLDRLSSIEAAVGKLQSAMDGISLEEASEDRAKPFASDEGNLKADEYMAAEKFAIAGEGKLGDQAREKISEIERLIAKGN